MNKKFVKELINEALVDAIKEMAKMKTQFTLADDWRNKAVQFQQDNAGKRGEGFNNLMAGLEKLSNLGHDLITTGDLVSAWGFKGNFNLNRDFKPALLRAGILIPLKGDLPTQQVDTATGEDDEFNISDLPDNELTQAIDKDLAFRKIKVDPKAKKIQIAQVKKFKVNGQFTQEFEYVYLEKKKTYTTSVFKFLKPYVEDKYSQKLPPEGITLNLGSYWDTSQRKNIGELFPQQGDFVKYMKENLPKWRSDQVSTVIRYKDRNYNWDQQSTPMFFEKRFGEIDSIDKTPFETNYIVNLTK
jgi:hypothetical protein